MSRGARDSGAEASGTGLIARVSEGMLAGFPLPAFLLDERDFVTAANREAGAVLGPSAVGRNLALSLRAPDLLEAISAVRAEGRARDIAISLRGEAQYQVRISPVEAGRALLCVMRDRSDEAKNEEMRRDFVANVSHELRTPLTAMTGFIETLQTSARADPAAQARFLGIMAGEAARMNRLVSDLLQLSRVEAGERVRPRDQTDLSRIILNVAATMRSLSPSGHGADPGRIVTEGFDQPALLTGDADQLTQVFLNLTENAVKYGARGAPVTLRLSRETTSRGPVLRVDVIDQGEGIDQIHLPRLTERFYRVDTHRSRAEGGTGLGLAIVKHIINRHGGLLKITSRKGEGSVFSVLLPEG